MKKDNNLKAVFAVNVVILTLIALNKTYKPVLEKLSEQYLKFKKENKTRSNKKSIDYKVRLAKILEEAKMKVGSIENLLSETKEVQTYLFQKFDALAENSRQYHVIPSAFQSSSLIPLSADPNALISDMMDVKNMIDIKEISNDLTFLDSISYSYSDIVLPHTKLGSLPFRTSFIDTEEIEHESNFPNAINQRFIKYCSATVALILVLNSFGINETMNENTNLDSEIITDLKDYFENFTDEIFEDSVLTSTNFSMTISPSSVAVDRKVNSILVLDTTYKEKFNAILELIEIPLEERCDRIIHSGITSYINIFNYILEIEDMSIDEKMFLIQHSGITSYTNIFQFILSMELPQYQKMEYIVNSDIATYEEIFDFLTQVKDFTLEQKVWGILLIPNQSFKTVFRKLLTIEGATQDQIIKSIIDTDLVSFKNLFDNILSIENLTKEQFSNYLRMYNADYNDVTLEAMTHYVLNLTILSETEKVDCIWNVMQDYSLKDKMQFILNFYKITYRDYINLYSGNVENLTEEQCMVLQFFEKVNEEKEAYILANYAFESKEQLDIVIACCTAEGANSYNDLYWIANVVFNRITHPYYVEKWTSNPYCQIIAPSQFSVYGNNSYKSYLYAANPSYERKCALARLAFYDMFYDGYDGIVHNYIEFRSWSTDTFSDIYIVEGGNRFGTPMRDSIRIQHENLLTGKSDEQGNIHLLIKEMNFD